MNINDFIVNMTNVFDDPESVKLNKDTKFRELSEWDSLTALMTIAMADDIYNVALPPEEMRKVHTVEELYFLIRRLSDEK